MHSSPLGRSSRANLRSAPLRFLIALVLAVGVLTSSPVGVGPAHAASAGQTCTGDTCTLTFTTSGEWTIPAGVTSATFTVDGASGSSVAGDLGGSGGKGAEVTGTLTSLSPGQTYAVRVGVAGGGGPAGTFAAPGGGYSAVVAPGPSHQIVAGGGGGGGSGDAGSSVQGGDGGHGGLVGTKGTDAETYQGGAGGTSTAGGAGGTGACSAGDGGAGGHLVGGTGSRGGAGGGAGWYGGGQGAAMFWCNGAGASAGGGGGSSHADPGVAGVSFRTGAWSGNGRVIVSYPNPVTAGDGSYDLGSNATLDVSQADGVLSNASGPTSLTASLDSGPTHGSLTLNSDGSFSYTPAAGFIGSDTFSYRATDTAGDYAVGTITLDVVEADLTVDVSGATAGSILPKVEYAATVTNNGPSTAGGTRLHATYSSGLGQIEVGDPDACVVDTTARTIDCTVGDLPVNESGTYTVTFRAALLALGPQTVTATAESIATDPDPANNTASATCSALTAIIVTC